MTQLGIRDQLTFDCEADTFAVRSATKLSMDQLVQGLQELVDDSAVLLETLQSHLEHSQI